MTIETEERQTFSFQAEVNQLLSLVVNSLYSHKEIFLRELISNASDALDRIKFRALTTPELAGEDGVFEVRIVPDRLRGTLTIEDTGIGMTREELVKNLGTIAHSGTRAFLDQLQRTGEQSDVRLIGQFGVGFYSAYLVADKVEVTSRAAGQEQAWTWTSDARTDFTVEPAERAERGTSVTLHLRSDQKEFVNDWRLRELIRQYSDFVTHPIKLSVEAEDDKDDRDETGAVKGRKLETVNRGNALWQRKKTEITDEEYEELYKHITHDWEGPLARTHFTVEGAQMFTALLYVPARAPFDLYMREARRGVKLFVKRVFVMEDAEELLPVWLRFVRGVVDSDDLPLNVSREILQDSQITRTIRKQVVKKMLDLFEEMAKDRPDDYKKLWETYGAVVKEGIHFEPDARERLSKLLRFESSVDAGLTSLEHYVARMADGQEGIYYIIGESRAALAASPHLEALRQKGYEVLYLTDAVDEWMVESLSEFDGKPLISAMKADLKLERTDEEKKQKEEQETQLQPLVERIKEILSERVSEVRLSERLTDSPACLVVPEGGVHAHLERLLRAHDRNLPETKRIFEINPNHAIVRDLEQLHERDPKSDRVTEWVEVLFDQSLLTEGSPLPDPNQFARRVSRLLEQAAKAAVS